MPGRASKRKNPPAQEPEDGFASPPPAKRRKQEAESDDESPPASPPRRSPLVRATRGAAASPGSTQMTQHDLKTQYETNNFISQTDQVKDYVHGCISKIRLANFVTYDSVVIEPGPGLNVVLGPNGSGKSSIVCAICLGLAGSTSSLGRASKESEYIKRGRDRATIEITLRNAEGGQDFVIKRVIDKKNSTNWFLNNQKKSLKDVKAVIRKLNINVDNLCQFLAQERVVNFAKLKPVELLQETEKAISPSLFQLHTELIKLGKTEYSHGESLSGLRERLSTLQQIQEEAQRDVDRWEEQKELERKLQVLEKTLPWAEYDVARGKMVAASHEAKAARETFRKAADRVKPLASKLEAVEEQVTALTREEKEVSRRWDQKDAERVAVGTQLDQLDPEIDEKRAEIGRIKREMANLEKNIEQTEARLNRLREEQDQLVPEGELDAMAEEITQERNQLREERREITNKIEQINVERSDLNNELLNLERRLRDLSNADQQRDRALFHEDQHAHNFFRWVDSHRHEFEGPVFGPVLREVKVNDRLMAKYVEACIPGRLRMAYIVSNQNDWNRLSRQSSEMNARAAVINQLHTPVRRAILPAAFEELKKYGAAGFLNDVIECPDLIRSLLINNDFANIGYTTRELTPAETEQILTSSRSETQTKLMRLITPTERHVVVLSRYADSSSVQVTPVQPPRVLDRILGGGASEEKKQIEDQIQQTKAEMVALDEKRKQTKALDTPLLRKDEELARKVRETNTKRKAHRQMAQRISSTQQKLDEYKRQQGRDPSRRIAKIEDDITKIQYKRVEILQMLRRVVNEWKEIAILRDARFLNRTMAAAKRAAVAEMLEIAKKSIAHLRKAYDTARANKERFKVEADRLQTIAKRVISQESFLAMREENQEWLPDPAELDEFRQKITQFRARISAVSLDDSAIARYKQRAEEIARLAEQIESRVSAQNQRTEEIEQKKAEWLPRLKEMATTVSTQYSKFFEMMGCHGEIRLHEDEDFAKFELQIWVRFREKEKLRILSAQSQSGGERSVSTMLFLLALQKVVSVPFITIDEINQGMDPNNERMIFDRIVGSSGHDCPQYFLVTPKLLPNLPFRENVTVLIVFNGPFWIDQDHFNLPEFIASQRRLTGASAGSPLVGRRQRESPAAAASAPDLLPPSPSPDEEEDEESD